MIFASSHRTLISTNIQIHANEKQVFVMRVAVLLLAMLGMGCGISRQVDEARRFSRCTFRFERVERVVVGGVDVTGVQSLKDLGFKKMGRLIEAATGKELILDMTLSVEAANPNVEKAALNRLEWILFADGEELAQGALADRVVVPGSGRAVFPVKISADIKKRGGSRDALMHLAFNLSGRGERPTELLLRIKPTLEVAGVAIDYPGHIDVRRDITSETVKELRENSGVSNH